MPRSWVPAGRQWVCSQGTSQVNEWRPVLGRTALQIVCTPQRKSTGSWGVVLIPRGIDASYLGGLGPRQGLGITAEGFQRSHRTWPCNSLQWKGILKEGQMCIEIQTAKLKEGGVVRVCMVGVGFHLLWRDVRGRSRKSHHRHRSKGVLCLGQI